MVNLCLLFCGKTKEIHGWSFLLYNNLLDVLYKPGVSFKQYQILHTKFIIQKYNHSLKKMVGKARKTNKSCKINWKMKQANLLIGVFAEFLVHYFYTKMRLSYIVLKKLSLKMIINFIFSFTSEKRIMTTFSCIKHCNYKWKVVYLILYCVI